MAIRPLHIATGGALLSAAASLGATAAWSEATSGSPREMLAAAGYAPGVAGAAAATIGLPLLAFPATRSAGKAMLGIGLAATAGLAAGKIAAQLIGIRPSPGTYRDEQLPAVNAAAARAEADATLKQIDRSADDIIIWAPGTMRNQIPEHFRAGVRDAFTGQQVSLVKLPTHPDYQIPQGVADSAEALKLIIRDLDASRRDGQRILLAGESQGSWAVNVALQDEQVAGAIDRTVVWGNPGLQPHQYDGAGDGRVLELTDDMDVVGRPANGDPELILDALTGVMDGDLTQVWRLPAVAVNNPHSTSLLLRSGMRVQTPGGYGRDPHNHREFMGVAARYLADAPARAEEPAR